jgi:RecA-family ATPase
VEYEWNFENLLTKAGLGMIGGEPGVGKTQLSNQFGLSTALGTNFLTWKNLSGPQKTLLLQLEMPVAGIQKFMGLAQSPLTSSQLGILDENLLISPLGSALPLDTESGRKFLIDLVQKHQPRVIVIDSLAKATSKSLSEEVPTRQLNDWLQDFRAKFGVTVVIIHHTRKGLITGPKAAATNPMDELLGSRYITGDLDFLLACYKIPKQKGYIYVRNAKNRYAEEHPDITIHRQPDLTFKVDKIHDDKDDEEGSSLNDFFNNFLRDKKNDSGSSSE